MVHPYLRLEAKAESESALRKAARVAVLIAHGLSVEDAQAIARFLEKITAEYYRRLATRGSPSG